MDSQTLFLFDKYSINIQVDWCWHQTANERTWLHLTQESLDEDRMRSSQQFHGVYQSHQTNFHEISRRFPGDIATKLSTPKITVILFTRWILPDNYQGNVTIIRNIHNHHLLNNWTAAIFMTVVVPSIKNFQRTN